VIVLFHRDTLPFFLPSLRDLLSWSPLRPCTSMTWHSANFRVLAMVAEAGSSMQRHISKSTNARELEAERAVDAWMMSAVLAMPRCKMTEAAQRRSPSRWPWMSRFRERDIISTSYLCQTLRVAASSRRF